MDLNASIEGRVHRIERQLRRANRGLVFLGCLLVVSIAVSTALVSRGQVVARELVIKDGTGRTRMTLGTNPDGRPLLMLQDASGQPGITMGYNLFDKPGVNVGLFGPRTRIGFSKQGLPTVSIQDAAGAALVELGVGPDGQPGIRIADVQDEHDHAENL